MREILFRGKRKHDEKMIFGDYIFSGGKHYISINDKTKTEQDGTGSWEVIPETIGQFTGLLDKNETKIFEGDVLKYYDGCNNDRVHPVVWCEETSRYSVAAKNLATLIYEQSEYYRNKNGFSTKYGVEIIAALKKISN